MEAKSGFSRYDAGTLTSNYGLNVSQQMGIPMDEITPEKRFYADLHID